jgi:hypothetical protein
LTNKIVNIQATLWTLLRTIGNELSANEAHHLYALSIAPDFVHHPTLRSAIHKSFTVSVEPYSVA